MLDIKLKLDAKSKIWLKKLHPNFKKGFYRGLKDAMMWAESKAKKSFGKAGNLKSRTGHLRRSIKSGATANKGWLSNDVVYAGIHEYGGTIKAKGNYLKFKIGNQFVSVKQVVIPARPFLKPAITENMRKIEDLIFDRIQKATK